MRPVRCCVRFLTFFVDKNVSKGTFDKLSF